MCVSVVSDVARGSYNIQQVQQAFAHAYHVLCNAVLGDNARHNQISTAERFLCTNSILSRVICMPHQRDVSNQGGDFGRRKLTSSERKSFHQKQTTPRKKHKRTITS